MTRLVNSFLLIATLFTASVSASNVSSPKQLLESVTADLFVDIANVNAKGDASPEAMSSIVEQRLLPHMDIKFVSYKLLGKHIKGLRREQAVEFIAAVEHYLTVTYAGALMKYTGQKVIFDQSQLVDGDYATVKTQIVDDNAPAIDLHFKLRQGKDKQWKVYDIVAEGISLLSAKQKEVLQRISQVGIDQVTHELASK
ncbi:MULTISPECIES: MlaC/ttg2D family ABC transporter substrate-binding protein [Pseudoalteromonas]|jgi:phospholipid transport system substrate-binding protein|uniref:ABC transporter substrate-binding protein n=1 Tax=Pseudoalteromonas lipolytica TaxID=570156 RepID=A0AAD0RYE4_9GAMM|nr:MULTISPECIES: ABC transporter substrate-binding protein [Pseudoalteromonas]AXV64848.1 ABC transporter substrate-binding protein [Pseudoalteromonas donghaensis]EWH05928.1 ABC transporter ATP-binding protein [Pseudoalteromonas lipolytica SCSIO 04301]MBE0351366.1 phospholipid transport system substrate-binding protein [Pseudoalteromonas lipolytica LMEB 39]QLJ09356.1 ABC transporter substrate-binding protein [Pseudoalteromonas sp. JSTW]QMW15559.1 ABC transporter substrate-binding protein [Pseud|tara:strand:+ start:829 stop:1422 length:594 start_codon:yes stop_codon:yes gene_type:complete